MPASRPSLISILLACSIYSHASAFLTGPSSKQVIPVNRMLSANGLNAGDSPFFADFVDDKDSKSPANGETTVVVAGATGYIGRAVVLESVKKGFKTIALVRSIDRIISEEGQLLYGESFNGAEIAEVDVSDADSLSDYFASVDGNIDTIVSCLASPVGTKQEAYAIDYQASLNCLNAGRDNRVKARHYVMLSAFCCQKPLLQLQKAKLKMEAELAKQTDLTWSVVRPTAFFKSVSGQLEGIQNGNPYVLFDDGAVTRCNPIAENELAEFMLNTLHDEEKWNTIMNVGGPDEPLTNKMLGEVSFVIFITLFHLFIRDLRHLFFECR
jgi:divinyl chlorophyllide a 8-vinyl-reductase